MSFEIILLKIQTLKHLEKSSFQKKLNWNAVMAGPITFNPYSTSLENKIQLPDVRGDI